MGLFYWPEVLVLILAVAIASADQSPPRRAPSGRTGRDAVTPLRGTSKPRYDGLGDGIPLSEMPVGSSARPTGTTPYRSPMRNDKHVTYSHAKRYIAVFWMVDCSF